MKLFITGKNNNKEVEYEVSLLVERYLSLHGSNLTIYSNLKNVIEVLKKHYKGLKIHSVRIDWRTYGRYARELLWHSMMSKVDECFIYTSDKTIVKEVVNRRKDSLKNLGLNIPTIEIIEIKNKKTDFTKIYTGEIDNRLDLKEKYYILSTTEDSPVSIDHYWHGVSSMAGMANRYKDQIYNSIHCYKDDLWLSILNKDIIIIKNDICDPINILIDELIYYLETKNIESHYYGDYSNKDKKIKSVFTCDFIGH